MMTNRPQTKTAWVKAMDYLARRDHSEKELVEKLAAHYPMDQVKDTITKVKERGWLLPPNELSQKVTENLNRKYKGYLYIQHFLRRKGLPGTAKNPEIEFEKANYLVQNKVKDLSDTKRLVSLLKNRGFDTETIGRIIHEIRRNTPRLY